MDYDKENIEIKIIEKFIDIQDKRILENGCGDGRISILLAHKAQKYIAIDPDEQHIRKAKSSTANIDFRIGNGEALEFEDSSFHVVLFTLSLHHQDSRLALKEAHRVLTSDGQLVILEPAADGELTQFFNLFDDETDRLMNAMEMMKNSDFEIEQKETFCAIMSFDNKEDLCSYPFGRDKIQPGDRDRIIETLQQLQGAITDVQPIHLYDKLHIFSLRKKRINSQFPKKNKYLFKGNKIGTSCIDNKNS